LECQGVLDSAVAPQLDKLRTALEGLVATVSDAAAIVQSIAVQAFSPFDLIEICSMNLDLLNIESIASEMEQGALECRGVLNSAVDPDDEGNIDPEDMVPSHWDPEYYDSDDSMHHPYSD
jgi:hypothetical protein